jgi:heat shock protein HspQ
VDRASQRLGLAAGLCYIFSMMESQTPTEPTVLRTAKFRIGDIVHHRHYPFRGVIYDADPIFANTEEWWQSIPEEVRPIKDQPYYHLLAENEQTSYVAYVSEQNLVLDDTGTPVGHPEVSALFTGLEDGRYILRSGHAN